MAQSGERRGEARPPEVDASLYLHPQTLARLASFELRAKMIVEGVMSGVHRSPNQGISVEFAEHRQYVPGDDIRHLDWKVWGRTDKLHLKQYQQETNLDLVVLVDGSGSMDFGSRAFQEASGTGASASLDGRGYWSKYDHATAVAAAISYITLKQGDRAGLVVFADEVTGMVARSSTRATWRQIVGALASRPVDRPTDLLRVVDQVAARITNRCLLVIVSDFFEDPERVRTGLARLRHRGHDAILFQVLDRAELEFDPQRLGMERTAGGPAVFEGLEGEPRLRVDPRALRTAYLEALGRHNAAIERAARGFGFDYHLIRTHEWLGPALAAFVARRNAQLRRIKYG